MTDATLLADIQRAIAAALDGHAAMVETVGRPRAWRTRYRLRPAGSVRSGRSGFSGSGRGPAGAAACLSEAYLRFAVPLGLRAAICFSVTLRIWRLSASNA